MILIKKYTVVLFLLFLGTSCQYFETEKISADTFLDNDLKTIDWEDVDQYPVFKNCEHHIEKIPQKQCFESILTEHLYSAISSKNIVTHQSIDDTVWVQFAIAKDGIISEVTVTMDSVTQSHMPLLKKWLLESIDSLPVPAPASKRGIPVNTRFSLPIIVKTEESTS